MRRLFPVLFAASLFTGLMVGVSGVAQAAEFDCKGWNTLSAFNNGQVFEARSCMERNSSGQVRAHTKVRCRVGTYGPHSNDYCNYIDHEAVTEHAAQFNQNSDVFQPRESQAFSGITSPDASHDYYTNWFTPGCGFPWNIHSWKAIGLDFRAASSSGQLGSHHDHESYIAENMGCVT